MMTPAQLRQHRQQVANRQASLRQYLNECNQIKQENAGNVKKIDSEMAAAYLAHKNRINTPKPIMTNGGFFTATGHAWLVQADGPFPVNDCDDRTTSPAAREKVIEAMKRWQEAVERNLIQQD